MNDGEVIEALGGYRTVATHLGITLENALHFQRRKIPWKYRPAIKAFARRKRVKLPADFLEKQRPV